MYTKLENLFLDAYDINEYPTLRVQRALWTKTRPFDGLKVLDATPLCRNSVYKYLNLVYGGAKLTVAQNPNSNIDEHLVELIRQTDIELLSPKATPCEFDVILDCAAQFINFPVTIGRSELTRSGMERYADVPQPVFMADGGQIKLIETCIGTGESCFLAFEHLGYTQMAGRRVVVMGSGKVGQGIIRAAVSRGIEVAVISDVSRVDDYTRAMCSDVVDFRDAENVERAILSSYALITATGQIGAVQSIIDAQKLSESDVLLANMGAEDEYGDKFAASRILAGKDSLNFILEDPTPLKYIDATLALHNYGAEAVTGELASARGIVMPAESVENQLLVQTLEYGIISDKLYELAQNNIIEVSSEIENMSVWQNLRRR